MADTIVSVQAASVEEVSTPVTITGVDVATAHTFTVQVAVIEWDATAPTPPIPDGTTTWSSAFWDADAPGLVAVFRVGTGTPVGALAAGKRYRVYLKITGGGLAAVEDVGTLLVGIASSYSGSPSTSARDAARFELGDTGPDFELTDAEVDYALSNVTASPRPSLAAAADLASVLALRYAREYESETNGDQAVTKGQRWKSMADLAAQLHTRAAAGDTGESSITSLFADPANALRLPEFTLGQMDNHQSATTG